MSSFVNNLHTYVYVCVSMVYRWRLRNVMQVFTCACLLVNHTIHIVGFFYGVTKAAKYELMEFRNAYPFRLYCQGYRITVVIILAALPLVRPYALAV